MTTTNDPSKAKDKDYNNDVIDDAENCISNSRGTRLLDLTRSRIESDQPMETNNNETNNNETNNRRRQKKEKKI